MDKPKVKGEIIHGTTLIYAYITVNALSATGRLNAIMAYCCNGQTGANYISFVRLKDHIQLQCLYPFSALGALCERNLQSTLLFNALLCVVLWH